LNFEQSPDGTFFGIRGARTVFYAWFLLAVFALDIGEYGMVGNEASMLMDRFWAVPNAQHIMIHGEHSWSGPSGWVEAISNALSRRHRILPSKLWVALAFVTSFLFTGLPLTGLVMQLSDGFRHSNEIPIVFGQRWETFNHRSSAQTQTGAFYSWTLAVPPRLPGRGTIYTNQSADRSQPEYSRLGMLPNLLPTEEGTTEIFLAPQSNEPVSGRFWGLMVRYNCSIVSKVEDFTILNNRNSSRTLSADAPFTVYDVGNDSVITAYNRTYRPDFDQNFINYAAVAELGYTLESYGDNFFQAENSTICYFNKSVDATAGYPGLDHESIIEVALWQTGSDNQPLVFPPLDASFYNFSLDTTVSGLDGAYSVPSLSPPVQTVAMSAVGVQCSSSSALGFADLDGITSTYSNFEQGDTPTVLLQSGCAPRLSQLVPSMLFSDAAGVTEFTSSPTSSLWPENFFTSAEAPSTFQTSESGDIVVFVTVRPTLLQAVELRRALLRAYASAAVQLMYNGGQGYSFEDIGTQYRFPNPNGTAYKAAIVISPGILPPFVPAIFLFIWCLGSTYLSLRYGFKKRWSATLDAFSLFRFGADFGHKVMDNPAFGVDEATECSELKEIPGLIGDSRPEFEPGHVSLVQMDIAEEKKYYS
jgi:hypothetical protein